MDGSGIYLGWFLSIFGDHIMNIPDAIGAYPDAIGKYTKKYPIF